MTIKTKPESREEQALRLIEDLADAHHDLLHAIQRNNAADVIYHCHETLKFTTQILGLFL